MARFRFTLVVAILAVLLGNSVAQSADDNAPRLADDLRPLLSCLSGKQEAPEEKYYEFLERERLAGSGLGFVDINILAALDRQPGVRLWTRDKRLAEHATRLGFAYSAE